jgi:hypothetical protein
MAEISYTDKAKLENIFEMIGGYVLNFTDASFQRFFHDTAKIEIRDIKYQKYGTSKANTLRTFWEIESNEIVGKVTKEMLLYYKEVSSSPHNNKLTPFNKELFEQCLLVSEDLQIKNKANIKYDKNNLDSKRIWGDEHNFKVFISHKAEYKTEASLLKTNLRKYGISCFVAHVDIEPSKEWQIEIEKALFSADALIALLTKDFYDSNWTDQEIGMAFARQIDLIPIRLGSDPHGFIGKFQALNCNIEKEFKTIVSLLLKNNKAMIDTFIYLVEKSNSFDRSIELASFLNDIVFLSDSQIQKLIAAYNENDQVSGSYGFDGPFIKDKYPFGRGLFYELKRITGKDYNDQINFRPLSKVKNELRQINDIIENNN